MDWNKKFEVTNIANGIIIVGITSIPHLGTAEVNPLTSSLKAIEKYKLLHAMGKITVTNDFESEYSPNYSENNTIQVNTVRNEEGDTRSHTIYSPYQGDGGYKISNVEMGKAVAVNENINSQKSVVFNSPTGIDEKINAREFLDQQWKKVQSEISKITDTNLLQFYLEVATEWSISEKKIEMLKNRIAEL